VNAEATSVMPQRVCRNRVLSLQSFFRRSSRYAFWQLDMFIKRTLFFKNLHSGGYRPKVTDGDKFAQTFGTIIPSSIPESSAWWKMQARELAAICDDGESGSRLSRVLFLVVSSCSLIDGSVCARGVACPVVGCRHHAFDGHNHAQQPKPGDARSRAPGALRAADARRKDRAPPDAR
jgi:hypothetical protein